MNPLFRFFKAVFLRRKLAERNAFQDRFVKAKEEDNRHARGFCGEDMAAEFLIKQGFKILTRNFFAPTGELDIVALSPEKVVVFVEVKRRLSDRYGRPCEAVTAKKQRKIAKTGIIYLKKNRLHNWEFRFDVIEILGTEVNHIENAFSSNILY